MTNPYVPLLIMAAVALAISLGGLLASAVLGPKQQNRTKAQNYECGIDPGPQMFEEGRFPIKYYLVAMTFIIFDIEVVFLYPWAVTFNQLQLFGLFSILLFIALLSVPYVYELRRKGLDWT